MEMNIQFYADICLGTREPALQLTSDSLTVPTQELKLCNDTSLSSRAEKALQPGLSPRHNDCATECSPPSCLQMTAVVQVASELGKVQCYARRTCLPARDTTRFETTTSTGNASAKVMRDLQAQHTRTLLIHHNGKTYTLQ